MMKELVLKQLSLLQVQSSSYWMVKFSIVNHPSIAACEKDTHVCALFHHIQLLVSIWRSWNYIIINDLPSRFPTSQKWNQKLHRFSNRIV
jgi:hypothetical protein